MMVDSYINNYLGDWVDETGNRLNIQKVDDETALVSFFAVQMVNRSTVLGIKTKSP